MSGVFSRRRYDECFEPEFLRQQVGPLEYQLDTVFGEQPKRCFPAGPGLRPSKHGDIPAGSMPQLREVEGLLRNIDIPNSRCMPPQTLEAKRQRMDAYLAKNPLSVPTVCGDAQAAEPRHSRLQMHVNDFRDAQWPAIGFPIINYQSTVFYGFDGTEQVGNSRFGGNTRLQMKDAFAKPKA